MNNKYWIAGIVVVVVIILGLVWAKRDKTVDNAVTDTDNNVVQSVDLSDGTYNLDTEASTVKWSVDYVKGNSEEGTIALSSGSVGVVSGSPASGEFAIDMTSLKTEDNTVIDNYLKMDNFLAVEKYPSANFKINKVLPSPTSGTTTGKYLIDGWLTIKGKTNAISFPIVMTQSGNRLKADSSFALNRADWGVTYDVGIRNAVSIELHIEATK